MGGSCKHLGYKGWGELQTIRIKRVGGAATNKDIKD